MRKYTQRELRNMVALGMAEDVTHAHIEEHEEILKKESWLNQVGYASGKYGCNGMLLQGHETGTYYAITTRSQAIYIFG